MFTFFKKKLIVDTSAEAIAKVTTILDENKIAYEMHTVRARGNIGSALDARSYAQGNIAMYKGASQPTYVYYIYVSRKDYDQARKLTQDV